MQRLPVQGESAGEDGAAERGGDSPEKCGGADEEISAQRMRSSWTRRVQDSVTESDDGAGSRNWSRRTGSKPIMTSWDSPEKMTIVGVSVLSCCSIISRRASGSVLMSRSSNAISLASRKIFISWQERQPGWVKSRTRGGSIYSTISILNEIFAVFSSMAETEQYFSLESFTASSTALRETLPVTR